MTATQVNTISPSPVGETASTQVPSRDPAKRSSRVTKALELLRILVGIDRQFQEHIELPWRTKTSIILSKYLYMLRSASRTSTVGRRSCVSSEGLFTLIT